MSKQEWLSLIKRQGGMLYVNKKWQPQLKDHPELRKLIKKGILIKHRTGYKNSRYTYLIIAQNA